MNEEIQSGGMKPGLIPGTHVFWTYEDLVLFGGALLPAIILGSVCGAAAKAVFGVGRGVEGFIMQFAAYCCWFAALQSILFIRYEKPLWDSLGWNPSWRRIVTSFGFGLLVSAGLIFISAFLDKPPEDSPMAELLSNETTLILVGLFSATLGPLCEELAFRGFLMPLLAQTFGVAGGIVLAAVPFAIAHAPQYSYSWRHVALIGLAGVAFGWNRFRTGSTAATVAMHSAYNLLIFSGLLYERYQW
jgi:membrane protease YdiL (CAAX protease family)